MCNGQLRLRWCRCVGERLIAPVSFGGVGAPDTQPAADRAASRTAPTPEPARAAAATCDTGRGEVMSPAYDARSHGVMSVAYDAGRDGVMSVAYDA